MTEKLTIHVCKTYQMELQSILQSEHLSDVLMEVYPSGCQNSNHLQQIEKHFPDQEIESNNAIYLTEQCSLFSANEAPSNSISSSFQSFSCKNLSLLINPELLDYYSKKGAFLVTPGWLVSCHENYLKNESNPSKLMNLVPTHLNKVILLDTGVDPEISRLLTLFSDITKYPVECIPVGLSYFHSQVMNKYIEWKKRSEMQQVVSTLNEASEQLSNYSLAFELASNLTRMMNEHDAIIEINHIFQMLFNPQETSFISVTNDQYNISIANPQQAEMIKTLLDWATNSDEPSRMSESEDGFFIRISFQSETLGVAQINKVALPYYCDKYLNMAIVLAPLFGLTISRARAYQKIKEDEAKLQVLASTDSLTGLANRRHFLEMAEIEFSRSKRYGSPLSVIMLDIDHFKQINDTFGHAAGDDVLSQFSHILTSSLRKSDIPARIGGDEFIILLPETSLEKAKLLGERLCSAISQKNLRSDSTSIKITSSMGVAEMDDSCSDLDEFIHHGDQALYEAKKNGRNQVFAWKKSFG